MFMRDIGMKFYFLVSLSGVGIEYRAELLIFAVILKVNFLK